MNWNHGIPNSCLVFLLLLSFSTSLEPSKGCIFEHVPIDTQNFSSKVENLIRYLLFDYQVSVPVNLKPDGFCQELWKIHLINRNLKSMISVSGSELKKLIRKIASHTTFVEECNIDISCVTFTMTNISEFLAPIPSLLTDLRDMMEGLIEEELGDFSNCTAIQCQPEPSPTAAPQVTAPKKETDQHSEHASLGRPYWGLLLIPLLVGFMIGVYLCKKKCLRSQRYDDTELESMESL
ncbi:fms-related tyrosine kinase 3 ligand [Sceloporus undulatus]|uniref:fms-related tyrosine kinase 3 ligand n=1 Tax=Sceloporus undulatus TaxID=8520 RepID=UPI001C4D9AD6|nr:fms-related tyrosine kinase 3 ligand [Sceloporus undulatus]XP_042331913.1 fms-related tyrosine kinase 3 ligand [Sceloporus undulatus]